VLGVTYTDWDKTMVDRADKMVELGTVIKSERKKLEQEAERARLLAEALTEKERLKAEEAEAERLATEAAAKAAAKAEKERLEAEEAERLRLEAEAIA